MKNKCFKAKRKMSSLLKKEIYNSIFYEFASNMTHFLLDLNYITNFFLYFLSGERFRNELLILLRCKKESTQAKTIQSMAAYHRKEIVSNNTTAGFSQPRDQSNPAENTTETTFVVSNKKFSLKFKWIYIWVFLILFGENVYIMMSFFIWCLYVNILWQ